MSAFHVEHKCLLVVAPNSRLDEPHLGVSLLKAGLLRHGIPAEVYYANAHLVEVAGLCLQKLLSNDCMLDAVYSSLVFRRSEADVFEVACELMKAGVLWDFGRRTPHQIVLRLICLMKGFRELVVRRIIRTGAQIVGFSSVFSDRLFCIDTICEIKKRAPHIHTIMGGPNCDHEMGEELFARFPEIDYMCQGYADRSLIDLVQSIISNGKLVATLPSVLSRETPVSVCTPATTLTSGEYDALPDPDFNDFFEQLQHAFRERGLVRRRGGQLYPATLTTRVRRGMPWLWALNLFSSVPLETCRGCWWASGSSSRRCAFCADMQAMQPHLQKSTCASVAQVRRVVKEYRAASVYLTDRLASPKPAAGFWDQIAGNGTALQFSTEAVGSIRRDMVRLLGKAGARIVQIGIESLDPSDLRAMGKPTSVIHNVAALKHFADFGMWPFWSYLGPTPASYTSDPRHAATVVESLTHLSPPFPPSIKPIAIYRFSKYFENPEFYGLGSLDVPPLVRAIYALPMESLQRLAHNFLPATGPSLELSAVKRALSIWARVHWRSHLLYVSIKGGAWLLDTRRCRRAFLHRLGPDEAAVYESCREPSPISAICGSLHIEETTAIRILTAFVRDRTMLLQGDLYVGLAVEPSGAYRYFRQVAKADFLSPFPLREISSLAADLELDRRWTVIVSTKVLVGRGISLLLSVRWRLACRAMLMLCAFLRHLCGAQAERPASGVQR